MTKGLFWQIVLSVYGFLALMVFGAWWFLRRSIRWLLDEYGSQAETADDPALASATEAAVILAREKYDRGEFRRTVVRRVPRDLFDDLVLECGHITMATREEGVASADCHTCANAWIQAVSRVKPGSFINGIRLTQPDRPERDDG
jgi:hypothetical protein